MQCALVMSRPTQTTAPVLQMPIDLRYQSVGIWKTDPLRYGVEWLAEGMINS